MTQYTLHSSSTRGYADHGWLKSHHTFSFAGYHDPERIHFGALRVLNDDTVAPGMGFGTHAHDNMEIISIPLEGDLEHRDSMGNTTVIHNGDIQVMSAGTGITHSEYNKNRDRPVKFLQIWIIPDKRQVAPRYGQITLDPRDRINTFQQVLSPNTDGPGLWIHQRAWFHLTSLEAGRTLTYALHEPGNGVYAFVLEGSVRIDGHRLDRRDGLAIQNGTTLDCLALDKTELLMMEVPMLLNNA
jgi:redox-sensitive bicupin YhaK (pirin superfamily)